MKPTKKIKRAKTKELRDQAPTVSFDKGDNSERGGCETDSEQPVLSPVVDEGIPA